MPIYGNSDGFQFISTALTNFILVENVVSTYRKLLMESRYLTVNVNLHFWALATRGTYKISRYGVLVYGSNLQDQLPCPPLYLHPGHFSFISLETENLPHFYTAASILQKSNPQSIFPSLHCFGLSGGVFIGQKSQSGF